MQNSKKLEKSKGVVVFAFNTDVDYVSIADRTSQLTAHTLGLPITLITDSKGNPKFSYDQVIRVDTIDGNFRTNLDNQQVSWRNFGRYLAYELSPYNETILIDTDYLVLDKSLLTLFETDFDYKLMHHNTNYAGGVYEQMGETSLPYIWATVILFRKTERARLLFALVGRIQRNYRYYKSLYNIREGNYRNDYAFAIANIMLSGYSTNETQGIPWPMLTVEDKIDDITILSNNFIGVKHSDKAVALPYQNLHVMDKEYLQSNSFKNLIEVLCEPA